MGKVSKLLSILTVSTLTFAMTACGTGGNNVTDQESHTDKKLTVGIWGGNEAESTAIEKVKADFEAATGATVEFKVYTDYNTQIQADFIGKTAPDVFYIDGNVFPFYSKLGVLEALDQEEMDVASFYPNLVESFKGEDGEVYAIPKDLSTLAIYYNEDLLASVGMTGEDIPDAWEDFGPFLTDLQAKLDAEYGVGKKTAMTYNQDLARNLHLLERNGASIIDENEYSTLSSKGVLDNLQFIVDLTKTGGYKTPTDIGFGWNGESFGTGNVAIMDEGNWVYGTLNQEFSDINFGIKDMPTYQGERSSMAFTVGYGIYVGSTNKELAKEWIKYATGVEGMSTWCSGAGTLPSREDVSVALDIQSNEDLLTHLRQVDYARTWERGSNVVVINDAYKNFLPSVIKGDMTAEEAMQQADQQANNEIENGQ